MKTVRSLRQKWKNALWKMRFGLEGVIATLFGVLFSSMPVLADTKKNSTASTSKGSTGAQDSFDYSFLNDSSKSNSSIDEITDKVRGVGASGYRLVSVLCVIVFFICGGLACIRLMLSKQGQKREETKDWITWILFAVAGFAGLGFIFTSIKSFVGGF